MLGHAVELNNNFWGYPVIVCFIFLITELDWRKLYEIYDDMSSHAAVMAMKIYPQEFEKSLKSLIKLARVYFPDRATSEIMSEFRPYFCPHDTVMSQAVAYCALFLPTIAVER